MTYEWKLYTRDANGNRVGEIEDYTLAELSPVFNDVGSWSITLSRQSPQAANLTIPRYGIIATRNDRVVFSGLATDRRHIVNEKTNQLTVSGYSDEILLLSRLVSPSPAEAIPPYSVISDVRSGVASTVINAYVNVNLGPGAVSVRRWPGLTIGTDPVVGAAVRGEARWEQDLLAFLQPLAVTGGIGFRIAMVGTALQFQTYATTDRSATAKFSIDLGNLQGFEYSSTAPKSNYAYVGASGTGTTRIIKEYPDGPSITTWGRWEGPLVNQGSTSDPTQMAQAAADALESGGEQASLAITPLETDGLRYGIDYFLGDTVTVQLEGPASTPYAESGQIVDVLRQVKISLSAGKQIVTPSVGTGVRADVLRLFRTFRQLSRRVNYLEGKQ